MDIAKVIEALNKVGNLGARAWNYLAYATTAPLAFFADLRWNILPDTSPEMTATYVAGLTALLVLLGNKVQDDRLKRRALDRVGGRFALMLGEYSVRTPDADAYDEALLKYRQFQARRGDLTADEIRAFDTAADQTEERFLVRQREARTKKLAIAHQPAAALAIGVPLPAAAQQQPAYASRP